MVLYRAGLRCHEACTLELEDWRKAGEQSIVRVSHPKGEGSYGIHRSIGLDVGTTQLVEDWLEVRGKRAGPLFPSGSGRTLLTTYLRRKIAEWGRLAGIPRRVHPHLLRHTFAYELHEEHFSLRHIQLALGHNSLSSTETYLLSIGASESVAMTLQRERRTE
jgi:integrase/recombinase XerC